MIAQATSHETVVSLTLGMDRLDAHTIAAITGEADLIARTHAVVMTLMSHEGGMIVTDESALEVEAATITTVMNVNTSHILVTAETVTGTTAAEELDIIVVEATEEESADMSRGVVLATSLEVLQEISSSNKKNRKTGVAKHKMTSGMLKVLHKPSRLMAISGARRRAIVVAKKEALQTLRGQRMALLKTPGVGLRDVSSEDLGHERTPPTDAHPTNKMRRPIPLILPLGE